MEDVYPRVPHTAEIVDSLRTLLRTLAELGFAEVVNVTGGWLSMQAEGGFDVEES